MNGIKKFFLHFGKICKHKYWVCHYCFKLGIPWRGITHDLSKFSPIEFWEGVKYYQGDRSPIDACKEEHGWSKAWMHHKGRNSHHYEYWIDDLDNGGKPLRMPFECVLEMLADYLGAGRAYYGKDFTYQKEYEWWVFKRHKPIFMETRTEAFVEWAMWQLANSINPDSVLSQKRLANIYYNVL